MSKARRTEKAWRHRDRESVGTYSLWATVVACQAIIFGICSIIGTDEKGGISKAMLLCLFFAAAISILVIVLLNIIGRDLDRERADYFERSAAGEYDHDEETAAKADRAYKAKVGTYEFWRTKGEALVVVLLVFMLLSLYWGVTGNAPF